MPFQMGWKSLTLDDLESRDCNRNCIGCSVPSLAEFSCFLLTSVNSKHRNLFFYLNWSDNKAREYRYPADVDRWSCVHEAVGPRVQPVVRRVRVVTRCIPQHVVTAGGSSTGPQQTERLKVSGVHWVVGRQKPARWRHQQLVLVVIRLHGLFKSHNQKRLSSRLNY